MSTAGHTPNFIAEEAIYPFRCVKVGTANFKAVPSTSDPEILLGVTDGSIQTFNGVYHATPGQPISLQNGEFVQLTAGGSIAVGDTLIATTDGKVIADTASTEYIAQAAEGAEDGEIFWAKKIGAWTIGGGGGGGTMTVDVQEFDYSEVSQAWTKPAGAKFVTVAMCGGGAGGPDDGPYGGGAGYYATKQFSASDLPSTVPVQVGMAIPYSAPISEAYFSYFGIAPVYLAAACGGAKPISVSLNDVITNSFSGLMNGLSTPNVGANSSMWGMGAGEECNGAIDGSQGVGPGGGGMGGFSDYVSANGGEGGKAGTSAFGATISGYFTRRCAVGGGGAGGVDGGTGVGGNGGNGAIDPVTGFGGGGGGGGQGGPLEVGGNGGNGVRGGGGGGPGTAGGFDINLGLPGAGGDGYVRVTTICFN